MENILKAYQEELLKAYFHSVMFYQNDMEYIDDAIQAVGYKGKKEDIRCCLYKSTSRKSNQRYTIFTDTEFFGQERDGRLISGKYSEIESIKRSGSIKIYGKPATEVNKKLAKRLKGIFIIYHLKNEYDLSLAEYIVSFQKPFLGEYIPLYYLNRKESIFESLNLHGLQRILLFSWKMKKLTATEVKFKISLNDKDLEIASFSEWEKAVDAYIRNEEVLLRYQELLFSLFCIQYKPENIVFVLNDKIKKSFSTRMKNAADIVVGVAETTMAIAESAMEIAEDQMAHTRKEYEQALERQERKIDTAQRHGEISEASARLGKEKIRRAKAALHQTYEASGPNRTASAEKRVAYQQGSCDVAFVFSCPGQKEANAGRVCVGKTGANLTELISYLHSQRPDVFSSSSKNDYTITNASDRVHYMALTKDTEASYKEISDPENLGRLEKELRGCRIVICMGNRATYAAGKIGVDGKILQGEHLGHMHLNRTYPVSGETPSERNAQRVAIIGKKILQQL